MKLKLTAIACLLSLGLVAVARAQEVKLNIPKPGETPAATAPAAAPAAPEFSEQQLIEEFGWFMAKRVGLAELEFSPAQIEALVKGLTAAAAGKDSPYDLQAIGPSMDKFMQGKQTAYMAKLKARSKADTEKFFTEIKAKAGVVTLASGLAYEIEKQGEGAAPKPEDTVKVHYTGRLVNGTVFDSSVERGEPVEFPLNGVIAGWIEGLQKISKGGKMKLYIPPQLAYGDEDRPGIPPASTLVFDVELLDIKPAGAAPVAAPAPAPTAEKK